MRVKIWLAGHRLLMVNVGIKMLIWHTLGGHVLSLEVFD